MYWLITYSYYDKTTHKNITKNATTQLSPGDWLIDQLIVPFKLNGIVVINTNEITEITYDKLNILLL